MNFSSKMLIRKSFQLHWIKWRQMSTLPVEPPTNINVHEHKLARPVRIQKPKVRFLIRNTYIIPIYLRHLEISSVASFNRDADESNFRTMYLNILLLCRYTFWRCEKRNYVGALCWDCWQGREVFGRNCNRRRYDFDYVLRYTILLG